MAEETNVFNTLGKFLTSSWQCLQDFVRIVNKAPLINTGFMTIVTFVLSFVPLVSTFTTPLFVVFLVWFAFSLLVELF